MTIEGLTFINDLLDSLNIPYQLGKWTAPLQETYWTGEYTEVENMDEDGGEVSSFILTGNTTNSSLILETTKEIIKEKLKYDLTAILPSGSGIAISYATSNPIPSMAEDINRLEIILKIKEWRC